MGYDTHLPVLILGCGYTGRRVAEQLLAQGRTVWATTREPEGLAALAVQGAIVHKLAAEVPAEREALARVLPSRLVVVHSVPTLRTPAGSRELTPALLDMLGTRPARLVYISTTGVYGKCVDVDAQTAVAPVTERQTLRVLAEEAIAKRPYPTLILRSAAIYGAERGIRVSLAAGRYKLVGAGDNYVSRIHVADLAAHVVAGLDSTLTGAYPVADERPCRSSEIVSFCVEQFGVPYPDSIPPEKAHETRRSNRRVDGRAIRSLLGLTLQYPTYREGLMASH